MSKTSTPQKTVSRTLISLAFAAAASISSCTIVEQRGDSQPNANKDEVKASAMRPIPLQTLITYARTDESCDPSSFPAEALKFSEIGFVNLQLAVPNREPLVAFQLQSLAAAGEISDWVILPINGAPVEVVFSSVLYTIEASCASASDCVSPSLFLRITPAQHRGHSVSVGVEMFRGLESVLVLDPTKTLRACKRPASANQ